MDERHFDLVTRVFAAPTPRRAAVALAAAALIGPNRAALAAELSDQAKCRSVSQSKARKYIRKAARKFNQNYKDMLCVAKCESALDNCAVNKQGKSYGMFQFIRSTWDSTPYKKKDIFDAKWSAYATGWMWKEGRKNEWTCWTHHCK